MEKDTLKPVTDSRLQYRSHYKTTPNLTAIFVLSFFFFIDTLHGQTVNEGLACHTHSTQLNHGLQLMTDLIQLMVQNASSSVKGKEVFPGHNDQRQRHSLSFSPSPDKMNKELTTCYKTTGGKKRLHKPQNLTNEGGLCRGRDGTERGSRERWI